ncbi:MBL fold metallo-hydrolase [Desulfosediminicola flagellatus]|uniref:MBL fold metallo-hydrolase n=1 Tax=Desulfosediminicola flagellatus TaxID=2569541 RepID=UPI001E2CAC33|nr:MBL fold metallo-hydrolase [Desulfosediminicola flagellatus]
MNTNNPQGSNIFPHHIKIDHLGGADCVTGSCHLVRFCPETDKTVNILVDCGSTYGDDPELPFDQFPVSPDQIDYLFLTHAHIDHIGRVPDLIDAGFSGEIICTHATKALLSPMLHDALSFSNRTDKDINRIEKRIDDLSWGFELYETFTLKNGITFKLKNAGHILGSCFILFTFPDTEANVSIRVIFSGDLGSTDTPILPDPDIPDSCDLLIMESTYGDRLHPDRKSRVENLRRLLDKALADNGIVYIPAFALGRTQELLYELDRIGVKVPVFVDSPLGLKITKIYSELDAFWDKEAKGLKDRGDHPLDFRGLYGVNSYRDHKQLLDIKGPAIIIAGSGMCTGGRIVDHLKHGLEAPLNDIFFVGYQAKGTPGRKMIEKKVPVKAGIHMLTAYSAHADQQMLVDWFKSMPVPPKEFRLIHGEDKARKELYMLLESLSPKSCNLSPGS